MGLLELFRGVFVHSTSTPRPSTPSKYHGKGAAKMSQRLKKTGGGDMASGITAEKSKAYWQGRNTKK
jgi:hypothetical protein